MAILILDKIDVTMNNITIKIKSNFNNQWSLHQEDITFINYYTSNNKLSKYMKPQDRVERQN